MRGTTHVMWHFNPRSPHGERRLRHTYKRAGSWSFQSTLPARGATLASAKAAVVSRYFNPRSPHGERRRNAMKYLHGLKISIHAPRTGSDKKGVRITEKMAQFQSTLPARGATRSRG